MIQTLGMLLEFRKAKNTRLAARAFSRFAQVLQHPACLDHGIQTQEAIWYFLINSFVFGDHSPRIITEPLANHVASSCRQ